MLKFAIIASLLIVAIVEIFNCCQELLLAIIVNNWPGLLMTIEVDLQLIMLKITLDLQLFSLQQLLLLLLFDFIFEFF